VGLSSGILLTTGTIQSTAAGPHGPNDESGAGLDNGEPGEPLLAAAAGNPSFNAARLEFDFVPQSDTIRFNYVFASEEYLEFVNGGVNDAFGFFISGPNPAGGTYTDQNIALVPGTATPITIDNVNAGVNSAYYVDNGDGFTPPQNGSNTYVQYDGLTTVLEASAAVTCGQTYHIIIVISDIGDGVWDSGVFLEEDSFSANAVEVSIVTQTGDTSIVEGCAGADIYFVRPESDTLSTLIIDFDITGTATNGVDYNLITSPITFLPGEDSVLLTLNPVVDGNTESPESVIITVYTINACGDTLISTGILWILEPNAEVNVSNATIPCPNSGGVWLVATPVAGVPPYTFAWNNGSTNDSLFVPTTSSGVFANTVTMTDFCGETASDLGTVTVLQYDVASFTATPLEGPKPLTVNFTNTSTSGAASYNWNFGNGQTQNTATVVNTSTEYLDAGEYQVTLIVTSPEGCIDSASTSILVYELPIVFAPNVFTPDGNATNEVFQFFDYENIASFECVITNRWGNVMTEFDDITDTWDGKVNGNRVEEGVYFYEYKAASSAGQEISGHGFFHLIRKE
jgi:gliding motility-associated-like protein